MGRSKAELFLHCIVDAAAPVFNELIAVQRHGDARLGITTIFEVEHEDSGPVFGLIRALEHAQGRCFVLATDYPLITTEILRHLQARFETCGAPLLVPVWHGIPQVLCAGYSSDLLPVIRRRVAEGKLDLRGLIEEVHALKMEVTGDIWLNVNTPADLEKAGRLL